MSVTSAEKELKELKKQQKAIEKKIKELDGTATIEKGMAKWEKISNVKSACEKLIKDAKLGNDFNSLLKLHKWPDYYIYQHPIKKTRKTADINEGWVQYFIGNIPHDPKDTDKMDRYGSWQVKGEEGLQLLRDTALASRKRTWTNAIRKQKRIERLMKSLGTKTEKEQEKVGPQGQLSPALSDIQKRTTKKKVATKKKVSKKVATRK